YTDSLCYRSPLPTSLFTFFLPCSASHRDLHSFPTRRSSDLYLEGFTERSKINVDLEISENFGRLPSDLETAIFRIVQECLTNIHRHSGSSVAKIRVTRRESQVLVEVADRGKGISPEKQKAMEAGAKMGVGTRGMGERVRQLGGTLEITSGTQGTLVVAKLPVSSSSSIAVA